MKKNQIKKQTFAKSIDYRFIIKNAGDYQDLHNITDILLLLGVAVNLRENIYGILNLVPLNFVTHISNLL